VRESGDDRPKAVTRFTLGQAAGHRATNSRVSAMFAQAVSASRVTMKLTWT
jgi:hypothetical protein